MPAPLPHIDIRDTAKGNEDVGRDQVTYEDLRHGWRRLGPLPRPNDWTLPTVWILDADSLVRVRRLIIIFAVCFGVVACGGAETIEPVLAPTTTSTAPTTTTTQPTPYQGFDADDLPDETTLVLRARGDVDVYADPDETEPFVTLEPATIIGTVTVLAVLEGPDAGWARVMLPIRPNGSEGWVEVDEMMLYLVHGHLVVDLSERTLSYFERGEEILTSTVAVGTASNPTPIGSFFVTDNVTLADPNSPWGPHALGLSGRSDTITEFNGGDGIIGIHGTNKPGSIGNAASLGCVRVPNEIITQLHEMIPVGTPVQINA